MSNKDSGFSGILLIIVGFIILFIFGGALYFRYQSSSTSNIPHVPGSYLKYTVPEYSMVSLQINYKYPDPKFNITFKEYVNSAGRFYLNPSPSESETMIVEVTAKTNSGKMSDTLSFTNKEWWEKVKNTKNDYAMEHTFVIK